MLAITLERLRQEDCEKSLGYTARAYLSKRKTEMRVGQHLQRQLDSKVNNAKCGPGCGELTPRDPGEADAFADTRGETRSTHSSEPVIAQQCTQHALSKAGVSHSHAQETDSSRTQQEEP